MQTKYEQLLETKPEWVAEISKRDLEDYLYAAERRYQERCGELVELGWEKALEEKPSIQGSAEAFAVGETIAAWAREIAMAELLEE